MIAEQRTCAYDICRHFKIIMQCIMVGVFDVNLVKLTVWCINFATV